MGFFMILRDLNVRPIQYEDVAVLNRLRRLYPDAFLEIPHGWTGDGIETAVAEKDGKLIGSLTGISAVVCDPFIHDPNAKGVDVFAAVYMLERALTYNAQRGGAVDSYIAVPDQLVEYHRIVERSGYQKTCEHCTIFRRPLRPDTTPLIENEITAPPQ